jgi:hypothetical protein
MFAAPWHEGLTVWHFDPVKAAFVALDVASE